MSLLPPPSVEDYAFACWMRGSGLNETRLAIKRVCGAEISKDSIRQHFAKFARGAA